MTKLVAPSSFLNLESTRILIMSFGLALSRKAASLSVITRARPSIVPVTRLGRRCYAADANAPLAQKFKVDGDRLW